ncbi:MAG: hypothetical protein HY924_02995 [Elusimicrobia bacterium]|nr:hypothetical protein [Elusimicrobiota bacterium]
MNGPASRRLQQSLAIVLLVMNTSGFRFVAKAEGGTPGHYVVSPARSLKTIARVLTKRKSKRSDAKSWRTTARKRSVKDLDALRSGSKVAPVEADIVVRLPAPPLPAKVQPELARRLPSDVVPVQPPHLSSKK